MKRLFPALSNGLCCLLVSVSASAQLLEEFRTPSQPHHPKTWMHALNGNLSKAGFTKDFEAMAEAGIGAAIFFSIDRGDSAKGPATFGSELYHETLVHAAAEAERVGIEFGLHNCDGWSSSGGTWITPEMSMKRITWSEATAEGGQTVPLPTPGHALGFYRDIAVLAWPANRFDLEDGFENMTVTSSKADADASVVFNGNWDDGLDLTERGDRERWIQIDLEKPATLRSMNLEAKGQRFNKAELSVSDDGVNFRTVRSFGTKLIANYDVYSMAPVFDGITGRHFRLSFTHPLLIQRLELWSDPKQNNWMAANSNATGGVSDNPQVHPEAIIDRDSVRVLHQGSVTDAGIEVPEGTWRILRVGYTSTGAINKPATPEGEGLECDKLSADILRFHFDQYVGKVARTATERGIRGLKYSEIDSYEAGGQNWTEGFDDLFEDRFGYDLIPWLPILTGRVMESPRHTADISHEFRRLIADTMADNYFGAFTEMCHRYGMESYIEPYGFGPFDDLKVGGKADRVMGEFWVTQEGYRGRIPSAVSSGRIYGKSIISAEAYTSLGDLNWRGHPYHFKPHGDRIWAKGVNEMTFHRFAHQPNTHIVPGMTMSSIGSHIDRTQTWWSNGGKAWFAYLARGSYLLQQGVAESDFLVHLGDEASQGIPNGNPAGVPSGFNCDYVNTDVLVNRMEVNDGWLTLPEGTRYRALYLHNSKRLRLETVERVRDLVRAGATVIGQKPERPIGHSERDSQAAFDRAIDAAWGDGSQAMRTFGRGTVSTLPIERATRRLGYEHDLRFDGEPVENFTHRRLGENDLYFFTNDLAEARTVEVDFRNGDGEPELWNVDTGTVEKLHGGKADQKRLKLSLLLEPHAASFVLVRRDGQAPTFDGDHVDRVKAVYAGEARELGGPWQVFFDPEWKGPGEVTFDRLVDWTEREESGIKHFSGTAVYTKTFVPEESELRGDAPVFLDLGEVLDVAEVRVNGVDLGVLWKPPYAVDIRPALQSGPNVLEVHLTNTWTNRLIGDEDLPDTSGFRKDGVMVEWLSNNQPPPPSERVTFTGHNFYRTNRNLQPSGLKGPVRLTTVKQRP